MSFQESSVPGVNKSVTIVERGKSFQHTGNTTEHPTSYRCPDDEKKKKKTALRHHKKFLSGSSMTLHNRSPHSSDCQGKIEITPLFSGILLDRVQADSFKQYGLLGEQIVALGSDHLNLEGCSSPTDDDPRIFLNVSPPWSAFICGSQGSGKSHTLSCILEDCLIPSKLGRLPHPLTAMVFHYDTFTSYRSNQVCEAAYLCSSAIHVRVLVSPTNYWKMKGAYENLPGLDTHVRKPEVIAMKLQDRHLDVTRMMNLMGVTDKEGGLPLYIEVVLRILREMAIEKEGAPGFDYDVFRRRLDDESFTGQQHAPLKLRLDLLESFMDRPDKAVRTRTMPSFSSDKVGRLAKRQWLEQRDRERNDELVSRDRVWNFEAGVLTIVDLSCPFVDGNAACALFNICLELFLEGRSNVGRIVALDEAHKFMTSGASATTFTENLLQVIRQQRHLATRVVISTQEPTISPKLLDLSTMTIVHRFTSPEWFRSLRDHLAGVSSIGRTEDSAKRDVGQIFAEILKLEVGEALLFSPSAVLSGIGIEDADVNDGTRKEILPMGLGMEWVKMRVRKRLTEDGGRSVIAV